MKSKRHFPSQADRNWKPINAFATHLEGINGSSAQYLYSSWSQPSGSLHGQLERHFTQWKRTETERQSSIILILLEFPLPSVMALILLNSMTAGSFSTQVYECRLTSLHMQG